MILILKALGCRDLIKNYSYMTIKRQTKREAELSDGDLFKEDVIPCHHDVFA